MVDVVVVGGGIGGLCAHARPDASFLRFWHRLRVAGRVVCVRGPLPCVGASWPISDFACAQSSHESRV